MKSLKEHNVYGKAYCARARNNFCDHLRTAVLYQATVVFSKLKMHAIYNLKIRHFGLIGYDVAQTRFLLVHIMPCHTFRPFTDVPYKF